MTPNSLRMLAKTLAVIVLATLSGCATLNSHHLGPKDRARGKEAGLTYYLPMRYAEVTFERRFVADAPSKSIKEVQAEQDAADIKFAEAKQKLSQASERVSQIRASGVPSTSNAFQKLVLAEIEAKLEYNQAERKAAAAKNAVAKTVADLQAWDSAKAQCGYLDRFSVTLQKPVADPDARYSLAMKHYPTRTDHWKYATTAGGLLSTVDGEVKDETAEIIVALARSAMPFRSTQPSATVKEVKTRSKSGRQPPVKPQDANDPCRLDWKPLLIQRVFDPSKESEWNMFFDEIKDVAGVGCKSDEKTCDPELGTFSYHLGKDFSGKPELSLSEQEKLASEQEGLASEQGKQASEQKGLPSEQERLSSEQERLVSEQVRLSSEQERLASERIRVASEQKKSVTENNNDYSGIYYRRELPLAIRIENRTKNGNEFAGAFLLMVPNHAPNDLMPLKASPFVTTGHTLGFDNGILVSVDSKRPSELLRAAAIPWDVASATIGAVTELVKFRVDYAKGNTSLVEEQVKLLEQLREQLEAQQALEAARQGGAEDAAAPSPQ